MVAKIWLILYQNGTGLTELRSWQDVLQKYHQIVVTLGPSAFHHLTGEYDTKIESIRGAVLHFGEAKLIPTFHPSFLLRNPSAKKEVYADMLKVRSML